MSARNDRLKAIQAYRAEHGCSLQDAKNAVDGVDAPSTPPSPSDLRAARKTHKLGFGYGAILEYTDGSASYRKPATFTDAFRVRISDVTGFSVSKGKKALERNLRVLGRGTELANADLNHGVAEKIEAWFRAHPSFGKSAPPSAPPSLADELVKLAVLRDQGALTDEEFQVQKSRLLGA